MKSIHFNGPELRQRPGESGQTIALVLLILSVFLVGGMTIAVDLTNLWFHRQAAQAAADAACTAGAQDMLALANGASLTGSFNTTLAPNGTSFDCQGTTPNTAPTVPPPCWYAATNGYPSPGLSAVGSNDVQGSFPPSVPGVTNPPASKVPHPIIRVDVVDRVKVFFIGLLSGTRTQDVRAFAECGIQQIPAALPISVLNNVVQNSLTVSNNATISIYGGPRRSLEVNSKDPNAINCGGTIDLSQGGPNHTGSDLGVFGGPATCSGFNGGTTGNYLFPATPVPDLFSYLTPPIQTGPGLPAGGTTLLAGPVATLAGCPDPVSCQLYQPGNYSSGINVQNATAIFVPGVYYVSGCTGGNCGMTFGPNSCVRPSALTGDGSGGTMFYLSDNHSLNVDSNSGAKCGLVPAFNTTSPPPGVAPGGPLQNGVFCDSISASPANKPANLPASLSGNVLLAPCHFKTSSACGDPYDYGDPQCPPDPTVGEQHGILFFQNRAPTLTNVNQPKWGGAGTFLSAGVMYLHQCTLGGPGAPDPGPNATCDTTNAFNTDLTLAGGAGSTAYVLGGIVADQITLKGGSVINMDLNASSLTFKLLNASLLR